MPIGIPDDTKAAPDDILDMINCGCTSGTACSGGRCGCSVAQLSCSAFCMCQRQDTLTCNNKWTKSVTEEVDDSTDEDGDGGIDD